MNKIIVTSVICLLGLSVNSHAQDLWEVIKTPVDVELKRVFYLDSLNLWAAGDSGTIIYSSDKGDTWDIQSSNLDERIHDIFFLNSSLGWAVTWRSDGIDYQSEILNTTDGGTNWTSRDYRHLNIQLNTIFFTDSINGWIGGEPFDFSYTTDGGTEWFPANIDSGSFTFFPVYRIKFSTPQLGFAVGGVNDAFGVAWNSTNGGESWHAHGIGPDRFLDFTFTDAFNALTLSNEIEGLYPMGVLKFDLIQGIFDYYEDSVYAIVYGMDTRTNYEIWATLAQTKPDLLFSNDSLKTWTFIPTPDSLSIYDIAFADSSHGIAVGERGYILRYIPQNPVSVEENNFTKLPNEFVLEQNYPNPFNPSTKIQYTVGDAYYASPTHVRLTVHDVLGNEITTLVNEQKSSGTYEVEFSTRSYSSATGGLSGIKNLASGIYFYKLQAGSFSETKKMVYLK